MLGTALWVRMFREEFQAMGSQPLAGLGVECGACFLTCRDSRDLLLHANVSGHFWKSRVSWTLGSFIPFSTWSPFFSLSYKESPWRTFLTCLLFTARKHKRKRRNNFFLMAGDPSQTGFSAPLNGFSFGVAKFMADGTISWILDLILYVKNLMSKTESWYSDWNGSTKKRNYSDICRWIADWNAPFDHLNFGSLPLQARAFAGHWSRGG